MKTKEQLAEEWASSQNLNRFAEEWAEKAFLAGYDARDAELSKVPEFDEVRIAKVSFEECSNFQTDLQGHNNDRFYFEKGARWQRQQDAKVIAAKELQSEQLRRDSLLKYEKIRELEEYVEKLKDDLSIADDLRISWEDDLSKLQAVNKLIDELDQILKFCSLENASRREVAFHATESLEKIKQWKEEK